MNAAEIRRKFLEYFVSKSHQIVPSAPLVVKNDPTLMFTNAGMNQFKDFFLGTQTPENRRVTDTQKCLRVSGKHNDLEEVGIDTYHHTMFEMLGNWSFGDYFKKEAIEWSWELLTEVYKLPKEQLYVTIFGGDEQDGLAEDSEAFELWNKIVPADRIIKCSKKDNFWEMGDTGPCGPCSEIHIDLRSEEERAKSPGRDEVNQDNPSVIEIWNLVFIQFNRTASGKLEELPDKHIDTGMGFERLVRAIQNKTSNYDTDVFQPLIQFIAQKSGIEYGKDEKNDIAIRVISDHVRAISFAITDGQLPANTGAGYVIRRILRRAVRYGYTFLGFKEPFICSLIPVLAAQFEEVFPELKQQEEFVTRVIEEEELSFLRTLATGVRRLDIIKEELQSSKNNVIDGKVVFELYDTFGFPVDLTALIARENGLEIDENGFKQEMEQQKNRSRSAATTETGDWTVRMPLDKVKFVGYDQLETNVQIVRYREVKEKNNTLLQVVFDTTPFYPEGGGQVGDTGYIEVLGEKISIIDTKKENDLIIHIVKQLPKDVSATFKAVVNKSKRNLSECNHSATHLLQSALREVLGDHVAQRGSLVNEKLLRFDFSHFAKLTDEEIEKVETIVNQKIRQNIVLDEKRDCPIDEAKKFGATALFGEKYGDKVRVVTFDPSYSIELCGGTHVRSTSEIGLFKIISESSVAAGIRRLEAVTSDAAFAYFNNQIKTLSALNDLLKQPKDVVKSLESLIEEKNELQKKLEAFRLKETQAIREILISKAVESEGRTLIIQKVSVESADVIKQVSFDLKQKFNDLILILAVDVEGKPMVSVMLSDEMVSKAGLNAAQMVKELAKEIQGGGGGQPFYATAGGKNSNGLDQVITKAKGMLATLNV